MTVDADGLRRLAEVVDALGETAIEPDGAQLLEVDQEKIRGQVTVIVPVDGDLSITGAGDSPETDHTTTEDPDPAETAGEEDEDGAETEKDLLDHTSTEDLRQAYDEADGNISAAAERFEVGYAAVYRRMVQHGVHETESDEDGSDETAPSTEGDTPTSDVDSESEAEEDVALEEEAADDDAGDTGVDVQDDPDPITVDAVGEPDDTEVELPEGVTEDDVLEAAAEHETLGDVGETIGVTRGRARTITVALDCYGDVKDLPAGGR